MQKFSVYHSDQLKGHIFAYSTGEGKKDKPEHETIKNCFNPIKAGGGGLHEPPLS